MAEYLVNDTDMTAVADAIRNKGGTSDALTFPGGFVDAVGAIQAGSEGGGNDAYYSPENTKLTWGEETVVLSSFSKVDSTIKFLSILVISFMFCTSYCLKVSPDLISYTSPSISTQTGMADGLWIIFWSKLVSRDS